MRRLIGLLFIIYCSIFIFQSSFVLFDGQRYFSLFDDGMISMRYGWNLSHGLGLVWNPGDYVEGYTNPLMTLFMAAVTFFSDKRLSVLVVQVSGIAVLLGVAYLSSRIALQLCKDKPVKNLALVKAFSFIAPLVYYPLIFWTLMGMETGLLTLLLLGSLLFVFSNDEKEISSRKIYLLPALLSLAFLTRPDSLVPVSLILVYYGYTTWQRPGLARPAKLVMLAKVGGILVFTVLVQEVFRWAYYGDIFPNTYILKATGMSIFDRLANGIGFTGPFLFENSPALVLGIASLFFDNSKQKNLLFAIFTTSVLYQIYVGGDAWEYWRMLVPGMVALLLLVTNLLSGLNKIRVKTLPVVICAVLLVINARFIFELTLLKPAYQVNDNKYNVERALLLKQVVKENGSLGMFYMGTVAYYTGLQTYDFLGKADKKIARQAADVSGAVAWAGMYSVPGHNKYDLNYSIKVLQPDFVESFRWADQDLSDWGKDYYRQVSYNGYQFYFRKDSPAIDWPKLQAARR